jgi:hypothetical protein
MVHNQPYDIVHNKIIGTIALYQGKELVCSSDPISILKKGQYKLSVCLYDPGDMIGMINPDEE